ncbi:MAG TPA: hypothetical protein VFJ58_03405 [Armatimonadota bacterium]|nr:hypothetical protein [Armatimonadota bacterium]
MRAGPLSDSTIISLLNRYFVPVYVSNEDIQKSGSAPAAEKQEVHRIFAEGYAEKRSVGTVHVYLLAPDGHLIDSMHVAEASHTPALLGMLQRAITQLGTHPGDPLTRPAAQSRPPASLPGSLTLHLIARGFQTGSWRQFPAENWIQLDREESSRLLPPAGVHKGESWNPDPSIARTLLVYFYPQTENNVLSSNQILAETLRETLISMKGGRSEVRLDGSLKMKHSFYPGREDNKVVNASFVGYLTTASKPNRIISLEIATTDAAYDGQGFGVGVEMVPGRVETAAGNGEKNLIR